MPEDTVFLLGTTLCLFVSRGTDIWVSSVLFFFVFVFPKRRIEGRIFSVNFAACSCEGWERGVGVVGSVCVKCSSFILKKCVVYIRGEALIRLFCVATLFGTLW